MNIIITGTSGDIGAAIAGKFLREGHDVYGFDIIKSRINDPHYRHYILDIGNGELTDIASFMIPAPDILINNAGTFEENDAIDINLRGTIRFTEYFLNDPCPIIIRKAGDTDIPIKEEVSDVIAGWTNLKSILFIASASARNGAEFPYYVASKAGIVGYMKNLAVSLPKQGKKITVNSISPGGVITSSNSHILDDPKLKDAVMNESLLGKWAEPYEIADLAYYLTVINRSMTGEDLLIDNGEMLKSNFIW